MRSIRNWSRRVIVLATLVVALIITPGTASALSLTTSPPQDVVNAHLNAMWVKWCLSQASASGTITQDQFNAGSIMNASGASGNGLVGIGTVACSGNNGADFISAVKASGVPMNSSQDYANFLCKIGAVRTSAPKDPAACTDLTLNSSWQMPSKGAGADNFIAYLNTLVGGDISNLTELQKYSFYLDTAFLKQCEATPTDGVVSGDVAIVKKLNADGSYTDAKYRYNPGAWVGVASTDTTLISDGNYDRMSKIRCDEIVKKINALAANPAVADQWGQLQAATSNATPPGSTSSGGTSDPNGIVCTAGPLGWVLCPLIQLSSAAITFMSQLLDQLLQFTALTGDQGSSIYASWQQIVNIANIILALALMAVIASQASSFGISAYGIKKMLPRIFAAAVLINLSYFICAIMVDISNILGANVQSFISSSTSVYSQINEPLGVVRKGIGAAVAIVIVIAIGITPVLVMLLLTLFVVALRLVLLIILIIIAPLAFAAWVLPNTEKYFDKWWDLFSKLLMIYPAAMFLFGAAMFAAKIIGAMGNSFTMNDYQGNAITGEALKAIFAVIQLLVILSPVLAVPALFKGIGAIGSRLHGTFNTLSGKMPGLGLAKKGQEALKEGVKSNAIRYGKYGWGATVGNRGGGPLSKLRTRNAAIDLALQARKDSRTEKTKEEAAALGQESGALKRVGGDRYGEIVGAQMAEAFNKRVKSIEEANSRDGTADSIDKLSAGLRSAIDNNEAEKVVAHYKQLAGSGGAGQNELAKVMKSLDGREMSQQMATAFNAAGKATYGDLVGKRGDVAKGFTSEDPTTGKYVYKHGHISDLGTPQFTTQSAASLHASLEGITPEQLTKMRTEAQTIINSTSLSAGINDGQARHILTTLANGGDVAALAAKDLASIPSVSAPPSGGAATPSAPGGVTAAGSSLIDPRTGRPFGT
ncbi:MAG: hypothetical protein WBB39_04535 [Candidatus Saccharimonadales bacterium]